MQAPQNIEINDDFKKAIDLLENSNKTLFITGKAGTGKSTLLTYFRTNSTKNVIVLAPTGVSAINVKGQTIHSFFRFKASSSLQEINSKKSPDKKLLSILKATDTIIIDEISMVRADLLDMVDAKLRKTLNENLPFGGLQMVFIGDLYQLPPVVSGKAEREFFSTFYESSYFFDAKIFKQLDLEIIELEKIYRQKDSDFIEILNKIRNNSIEDYDLEKLNERFLYGFENYDEDKFFITLTTTNAVADNLNDQKLRQLEGEIHSFYAEISGKFEKNQLPTSEILKLKIGSQVMMLNNDSMGRWVNGSVGKIIDVFYDEEIESQVLEIILQDNTTVFVEPHNWELFNYTYNKKEGKLDMERLGSFKQFPLRLAWAITIHKSQGKTFENVIVDIGSGAFAQGQVYVAISRSTSLEGLILKRPIHKQHIWTDYKIVKFLTKFQYDKSEVKMPISEKMERISRAINEKKLVKITYLKSDDTKSSREVLPYLVGEMQYSNKSFIGMEAFCTKRNEKRCFRIDRILEIE